MPGNIRRKANRYASENGITNVFLSRESYRVTPVVMNYKIRHNKNQPVRYSLGRPDRFSVIICDGRKRKNMVWI